MQWKDDIMHFRCPLTVITPMSIDGHHPIVYKLISHFLREQENTENKILRYNAGERSKDAILGLRRSRLKSFHGYDAVYDGSVRLTRFCDVCRIMCSGGEIHLDNSVVQYCTLYRYKRTTSLLHAIGHFIMAPKCKPDSSDPKEKDAAKKRKAITMEVKVDIIRRSDKGGNTDRNRQVITT
ncbi:hypothetical protein BgiMline_002274 [Biomphalaria glabrata]|nr:hypothetical protein BgiMline_002145 [Biomphalaria glabrata]